MFGPGKHHELVDDPDVPHVICTIVLWAQLHQHPMEFPATDANVPGQVVVNMEQSVGGDGGPVSVGAVCVGVQ